VTGPSGSAGAPLPGGPPRPTSGRSRRWVTGGLALVLAGLVAVVVALVVTVVVTRGADRREDAEPRSTPPTGSLVPSSELAGEWSGEGSLSRCAGWDEGCPRARSVTLTIDCSRQPCAVTPFDSSYGAPPLEVQDGSYRAVGPVPARAAPTCDGVPTSSARWQVDLTVRNGRLVGSYAESTVQGFDCGATGVAWDVVLDHG
jgi:hypothetical protein